MAPPHLHLFEADSGSPQNFGFVHIFPLQGSSGNLTKKRKESGNSGLFSFKPIALHWQ
jgi:hypothetical protein